MEENKNKETEITNLPENSEAVEAEAVKKNDIGSMIGAIYEIIEMIGMVTAVVMIIFAFIMRINIVDGKSMDHTLSNGEYLAVTDLFYKPERGDIVVIHKINAFPYQDPIVKRIIALGGDTVDIDSASGTVYVNGEALEEDYAYFDPEANPIYPEYDFPITVPDNEVFVLGDNRHHSGDSRQIEIGTVDERCIVGKAVARLFPFEHFAIFK